MSEFLIKSSKLLEGNAARKSRCGNHVDSERGLTRWKTVELSHDKKRRQKRAQRSQTATTIDLSPGRGT
jgi:hypothetical protein